MSCRKTSAISKDSHTTTIGIVSLNERAVILLSNETTSALLDPASPGSKRGEFSPFKLLKIC